MNEIEKLEWMEMNKAKLDEIFSEPIVFGIINDLQNSILLDEASRAKDTMTDEEKDFINNAFLGANPLK